MRDIRSTEPEGTIILALPLQFSHRGHIWEVSLRKGSEHGDVLSLNKQREDGIFPVIEKLETGNKILHSHQNLTLRQACIDNLVPDDVAGYIAREIEKQLRSS